MSTRIQRRRTRGWQAPLDAEGRKPRYVGRGTPWGNSWVVARTTDETGWAVNWAGTTTVPDGLRESIPARDQRDAHALAVELYQTWLYAQPQHFLDQAKRELAGRDLMCWCPEALPCHADALLCLIQLHGKRAATADPFEGDPWSNGLGGCRPGTSEADPDPFVPRQPTSDDWFDSFYGVGIIDNEDDGPIALTDDPRRAIAALRACGRFYDSSRLDSWWKNFNPEFSVQRVWLHMEDRSDGAWHFYHDTREHDADVPAIWISL
ncbi:DUF4326 domain-containing protein [Streptomyces odontomachi]|uniref:DUF4326 domain-containing protein n=1 Tax=Streptomyces odontomachi TaxID=2944940 RepID=UPI002108B71C|nr:DUF4326 domain-containing protein [Streptomyces sp. ODS25]